MWRRARPCSFSGLAGGDVDSFTRRPEARVSGFVATATARAQQRDLMRVKGGGRHLEIDDEAV